VTVYAQVGLIHICTFTLLLLSGERNFGVALNRSFQTRLPINLPLFHGTHADLLIIVLHKTVVNGYDKLETLYNCFLTIISNVSPYCKSLCMVRSRLCDTVAMLILTVFHFFISGRHRQVTKPVRAIHVVEIYLCGGGASPVCILPTRHFQ
jgi:hypothetical protein